MSRGFDKLGKKQDQHSKIAISGPPTNNHSFHSRSTFTIIATDDGIVSLCRKLATHKASSSFDEAAMLVWFSAGAGAFFSPEAEAKAIRPVPMIVPRARYSFCKRQNDQASWLIGGVQREACQHVVKKDSARC